MFNQHKKAFKNIKSFKSIFLLIVFLVGTIFPFVPLEKASAAGEKYTFYYPGGADNSTLVRRINSAIKDKSKEDDVLRNTAVYAKGGIWSNFGNKPIRFSYSKDDSNRDDGWFWQGEHSYFLYRKSYNCAGGNPTLKRDSQINRKFYRVHVTAILHIDPDSNGLPFNKFDSYRSRIWIRGIDVIHAKPSPNRDGTVDSRVIDHGIVSYEDDGDTDADNHIDDTGIPRSCLPSYNHGDDDNFQMPNYHTVKNQWRDLDESKANEAVNRGAGGAAPEEGLTDCDVQLLNPLSWIICPLIQLGANGSDLIFEEIVEPLLNDIPLSTDPEDGFFQAWQGFRFIANIILVIGMLGIVYSMARGDR